MIRKSIFHPVLIPITYLFFFLNCDVWAVTTLKTAAQDSYPKYYMKDGIPSGLCPAFLHAIEAEEPSIKFVGIETFMPTKRIQNALKDGTLDAFACFAPTEERKKYIDFIEL